MLLDVSFTSEMGDFLGGNALPLHQNGDDIFLIQLGKRFPSSNNSVDNGCCSPVTGPSVSTTLSLGMPGSVFHSPPRNLKRNPSLPQVWTNSLSLKTSANETSGTFSSENLKMSLRDTLSKSAFVEIPYGSNRPSYPLCADPGQYTDGQQQGSQRNRNQG